MIVSLMLLGAMLAGEPGVEPTAGRWRAWLDSPGGELPFELELETEGNHWRAAMVNGASIEPVPRVEVAAGKVRLLLDHYDAGIEAAVSQGGRRLDGEWTKQGREGAISRLRFHAELSGEPRFRAPMIGSAGVDGRIAGRWLVKFSGSEKPAIGLFETAVDGTTTGTFLTETGDYRFLAGVFDGDALRLSTFDGAHAFLFHARLETDGTLRGDFWSRDAWHETWTAERDDHARLPEGWKRIGPAEPVQLSAVEVHDLEGKAIVLSAILPAGKPAVVEIFGTWCPNCHDASKMLAELDRLYGPKGLAVAGIAFELDENVTRSVRQVKRFADRHGARYHMVIGGVADKAEIARRLPFLEEFQAYPTFVFLDREHRIRAMYSGFSGPAAGSEHLALRAAMEERVRNLLESDQPSAGQD